MNDDGGDYTRTRQVFPSVSHYYGDVVRQLFITVAAFMILGAPFYADTLSAEIPFEIVGAIVLAALAALANPHSRPLFFANAVAAGVGLLIYETWALTQYDASSWVQFVLREVIAVMFLVAFYFSMKTLRAFIFHQIGKYGEAGEFDEDAGLAREENVQKQKPGPKISAAEPLNHYIHIKSKSEKQVAQAEESVLDDELRHAKIAEDFEKAEQIERDIAAGRT